MRLRWRRCNATRSIRRTLRAAAGPVVAITLASQLWLATGYGDGAAMTMTAALFASLLSSNVRGDQVMRHVLTGCSLGVVLGEVYRLALLPHVGGTIATVGSLLPMLLFGAWLIRRPATKLDGCLILSE
ncbi:FUSC family protein [Sphingomonas sp. 22176]|uniref:FUSC family protein n=1 Tax=Sphingomonas sp. 22176 TaxID=3453884 RepID=UPI003F87C415